MKKFNGCIVAASFENGEKNYVCGLDNCECPDHEKPSLPAGTYITIRLDEDIHVGPFRVSVTVEEK